MTNDDELAATIRMVANHGQKKKYYHSVVGVNSRLDSLRAGILKVKLKQFYHYAAERNSAATFYDNALKNIVDEGNPDNGGKGVTIPIRQANSTHVFHQYPLLIQNGKRNALQAYLQEKGIPTMIYHPVPLYKQEAFATYYNGEPHAITESLCDSILSFPMHTEMDDSLLAYITESIQQFFRQ
jgi:UDP-2-acetamido-2-deoxy-ribo-hexuluronate aminotransferase